jgi:thiamine-monophosphate kinase
MTYDTGREFGIDPTVAALNGGEDYELLFTIAQADHDKIKNLPDISIIGYMTPASEGCEMISKSGNLYPITAQGWNAFKKND